MGNQERVQVGWHAATIAFSHLDSTLSSLPSLFSSIANCPYFHRDTSVDDGATCFDSETESSGHGTPELKSKVLDLNDTDAFPALSTPAVPVLEKSKKKEKKNKRAASPAVTIMVTDEDGYEGTLSSSSSFSWSQPIELNVSDISFTPREYKLTPPPGLYYMFRRNVTELIPLSLLGALDCE